MKELVRVSLLVAVASLGLIGCSGAGDTGEELGVASAPIGGGPTSERYIVKFHDYSKRNAVLHAVGAQVALELPGHGAVAAYMPAAAANGLANHPSVEYVEVDPRRYPMGQVTPYGIGMVQANDPAFSSAGGSVKVCIIDSGLYTGHADLQGIPITGEAGTSWNEDGCGHGTHVAGTIAAVQNTTGVVGVAPKSVALHIVRVFGNDCSWTYASGLVAALGQCTSAGAKVVSMSLGGGTKSVFERSAFQNAYDAGILSIAAAGNAGSMQTSYPAGYSSVVSVAAIDQNKARASFSQRNRDVEIAAPGVGVLSTVPWTTPTITVDGNSYNSSLIESAAQSSKSGTLVNGGDCTSSGAWTDKVVLCVRGGISFYEKVVNVKNGGGIAALIYNNVPGPFSGTLGTGNSSSITAVSLSQEDGQALVNKSGAIAAVNSIRQWPGTGYEAWSGTSMATPHVSGVAALIWSFHSSWTNQQIRNAINHTAQDLGASGRDTSFGYGFVQAKAALDYLNAGGT